MDDVWFEPGLTTGDLDGFIDALALRGRGVAPLVAATVDGGVFRLVAASRAILSLFRVADGGALAARLLTGSDPGSKRLMTLVSGLPLDGAPRLERLRFFIGPGSEVITMLCRRVAMGGRPVFVAAALGVREGLIAPPTSPVSPPPAPSPPSLAPTAIEPVAATAATPSAIPAPDDFARIAAAFRSRFAGTRNLRFLWRTDGDCVVTELSPQLADAVGARNGALLGADLLALSAVVDPSGRFTEALERRSTWNAFEVPWPLSDGPAAVMVSLGAVAVHDPERDRNGFNGFGVIHLDRLVARDSAHLPTRPAEPERDAPRSIGNVVRFPGKTLSAEDQVAFDALGLELRDKAGLDEPDLVEAPVAEAPPSEPPAPETLAPETQERGMGADDAPAHEQSGPLPLAAMDTEAATEAEAAPIEPAAAQATSTREQDVARNGLAMLDRVAIGLLVSRDNVPIFANRHLLDHLGYADEDALYEAGGLGRLFGGQPGNATGSEAIGVRHRNGSIVPASARMQRIEWDGLPATLLTLQTTEPPAGARRRGDLAGDEDVRDDTPRDDTVRDDGETRELRAIIETATDGVAVIDAACNVLSLNRSAEALFGRDRGTAIGKPFLDLFAPHAQDLAADYFEGLKSNPTKSLLNDGREFLVKAPQGGTIPVFMTLGRLGGSAPDGARFCALFRDLTHWKKVEAELDGARKEAERASALKSDFLAKVSHEVRTPLNAIIGFAEVILEERFGPVGNARYKDYLHDIHASGTHVMSLVNDLLDLSKIEAGKMELAVETVDANKVIADCVAIMQPQASRERVIMRLSLAPRLPRIKADERSLRQIVLNILSNAVKFNEPGGQVIVATATTEDGKVVIRIRDTGQGMSDSDIAAALEPFRQLSTSRQTSGTGLGLPLTKALVEANEASFLIRSKLTQGTLVEVAFPKARVLAADGA